MRRPRLGHTLYLFVFAIAVLSCRTTQPVPSGVVLPKPTALVTDSAGVLSPDDVKALEAKLQDLQSEGLAQAIVYIAPSLPPGTVMEDVTLRSVNAWGVGRRGVNDGLAIFAFMADHKIRIELGTGLERSISNEEAKSVIDNRIAPAFRAQKYVAGLIAAVDELHAMLKRSR